MGTSCFAVCVLLLVLAKSQLRGTPGEESSDHHTPPDDVDDVGTEIWLGKGRILCSSTTCTGQGTSFLSQIAAVRARNAFVYLEVVLQQGENGRDAFVGLSPEERVLTSAILRNQGWFSDTFGKQRDNTPLSHALGGVIF